jgi:hypothetical protein
VIGVVTIVSFWSEEFQSYDEKKQEAAIKIFNCL